MSLQIHTDVFSFSSYEEELARIKTEMEQKIRAEIRQEMESKAELERIRTEMEAKIRAEMEEQAKKEELLRLEKEKEEELLRLAKEKEEEDAKQREMEAIIQHNAKMVDVFMRYFTQVFGELSSHRANMGDVNRLKPLLLSLLRSLDSRALHLTSRVECHTNSMSPVVGIIIHVYLITTTSVFHTYLENLNVKEFLWRGRPKKCGELIPLYTFKSPLVVGSMEETILSKVCSRYCARLYKPDGYNSSGCHSYGMDKQVGQGSIPILQDIVHSIPGTPSKDSGFL